VGELVHIVAGLAAEQDRQLFSVVGDRMDHERGRLGCQPVGAVLDRQAHEKPGRLDRDLRGKSDQAAVAFFAMSGCDNEQGVVNSCD